jgi:hypothetical protein
MPKLRRFRPAHKQLKAHIDIPDLYIFDYTLSNVRCDFPKVHFELPLGRDPEQFEGMLTGETISGKYSGRFYKEEAHSAVFRLWREKRDERYTREEVSFTSGNVKLAGTLFVPLKKGAHPAIVFFHGSGPQTRESYLRYFADFYARRGFATLIYDKRGTGRSTGEIWYRTGDNFDNLVADALAGLQFLLKRNGIDPCILPLILWRLRLRYTPDHAPHRFTHNPGPVSACFGHNASAAEPVTDGRSDAAASTRNTNRG